MSITIYDEHGIRFEYPADWEEEATEDGPRSTVEVSSPGGLAFALVTMDEDRPVASEMADEALAALREEYPSLNAYPALESIGGFKAVGHDVEFISLDLNNSCSILCFRTPRRTVFVLSQWSDLEEDEAEAHLMALRRSIVETDG